MTKYDVMILTVNKKRTWVFQKFFSLFLVKINIARYNPYKQNPLGQFTRI